MKRRLVTVVALVGLAVPAAATADPGFDAPAHTDQAWAMAVKRFGAPTCVGDVRIGWAHLGAGVNAKATWHGTTPPFTDCSVTFGYDVGWSWPKLCTVAEHEDGHLTGHPHTKIGRDVMSPFYIFPTMECSAVPPEPAPAAATSLAPVGKRCFTWRAWSFHRRVCGVAR